MLEKWHMWQALLDAFPMSIPLPLLPLRQNLFLHRSWIWQLHTFYCTPAAKKELYNISYLANRSFRKLTGEGFPWEQQQKGGGGTGRIPLLPSIWHSFFFLTHDDKRRHNQEARRCQHSKAKNRDICFYSSGGTIESLN